MLNHTIHVNNHCLEIPLAENCTKALASRDIGIEHDLLVYVLVSFPNGKKKQERLNLEISS